MIDPVGGMPDGTIGLRVFALAELEDAKGWVAEG